MSFGSLTDTAETKMLVRRERWREAEGRRRTLFAPRLHKEV